MKTAITCQKDGDAGYFTVCWSHFEKADKYTIVTKVPAMGGIIELYYMDDHKKLNLFCITRSWYGGLRSTLREMTDPLIEQDPFRLSIITKYEHNLYYRYSFSESHADMMDVVFFLVDVYWPDTKGIPNSGRFDTISVKEIDAEHLTTI